MMLPVLAGISGWNKTMSNMGLAGGAENVYVGFQ
jgi:hypothetical protein